VENARRCVVCHAPYPGSERFCPIDGGAVVEVPTSDGDDRHLGKTIDNRYLVRRLIGRGGMGSVYEADHIGLDKRVAIKFLRGEATDRDALARFHREARTSSRIVHENVVQIFDVGTDDDVAFIVMEYVEGHDLRQILAAGALEPARAIAIAKQMLDGLDAIHQGGILHRDIKPENVLVTTHRGRDAVKIMDFGISKHAAAQTLTDTGKVVGTPRYMSPEQLSGADVDPRSDLYAVGLTLYEMLVGSPTFDGESSSVLAAMHLSQPPPSLAAKCPGLPAPVIAAVERALAKAPSDRFADARAFAAALDPDGAFASTFVATADPREAPTVASRQRPAPGEKPAATVQTRSRRWPWAIVTVLVIAGGIAVALVLFKRGTDAEPLAVTPAISTPTAPTAAQHLDYARIAENAGKLELAIAEYEAAYAVEHGVDSLFRIAGLYERLGNRAEAARYLERYLETAPAASDHDVVAARIAALESSPQIHTGDGGGVSATRSTPKAPAVQPPSKPLEYCQCLPLDNHDGTSQVCKAKLAPKCRCERTDGVNLCPVPFSACSGSDCAFWSSWDGKHQCAHPGYTGYVLPGTHGGACNGYANPQQTAPVDGVFVCEQCVGTSGWPFRGHVGDHCDGFHHSDGRPVAGRLDNCRATIPR
jgi:serine/threonine-protein kinase